MYPSFFEIRWIPRPGIPRTVHFMHRSVQKFRPGGFRNFKKLPVFGIVFPICHFLGTKTERGQTYMVYSIFSESADCPCDGFRFPISKRVKCISNQLGGDVVFFFDFDNLVGIIVFWIDSKSKIGMHRNGKHSETYNEEKIHCSTPSSVRHGIKLMVYRTGLYLLFFWIQTH